MGLLLGAKELDLTVAWRFGFVGYGQHADTTPGVLYFDVGGCVKPGVLDHHADTSRGDCAADLVFHNPELVYNHLMGNWLRLHEEGRVPAGAVWAPTLVTHAHPDWDGAVASFLIMHLIEEGQFPPWAEALVGYTRQVDQGRYKLRRPPGAREIPTDELFAPHIGYLAVQNLKGADGRGLPFDAQLRRGHELIRRVVALMLQARASTEKKQIGSSSDFLPGEPGVTAWRTDPWFADIARLLEAEPEAYAADKAAARVLADVPVPAADGGDPLRVRALVLAEPPRSALNKYWVRADPDDYGLFVCPYDEQQPAIAATPQEGVFQRVAISVDPCQRADGRTPTLRGLGFALEQAESARRRSLDGGLDDRGGAPRFPDGYCDNADPWYDGRAFDFTIVDAPNIGTCLPYQRIVAIATATRYWEIPLRGGAVTLVWVTSDSTSPAQGAPPLPPFEGMADTLRKLYEGSTETETPAPRDLHLPSGCEARFSMRRFPAGISPALHLAHIDVGPGGTLEGLVAARARVVEAVGAGGSDYALSRVSLGRHFCHPARVSGLLHRLADSEVTRLEGLGGEDELVLFNSRTVIFREQDTGRDRPRPDPDLEILLYVTFLNESLVAFSKGIADLALTDQSRLTSLDAGRLRREFLAFQTLYCHLEASRRARGHALFLEFVTSLHLSSHYGEVQSELDRLAELENQLAEERKSRAERIMEAVMYVVAVCGTFQTLLAFFGVSESALRSGLLWGPVIAISASAAAVYLKVVRSRRKP